MFQHPLDRYSKLEYSADKKNKGAGNGIVGTLESFWNAYHLALVSSLWSSGRTSKIGHGWFLVQAKVLARKGGALFLVPKGVPAVQLLVVEYRHPSCLAQQNFLSAAPLTHSPVRISAHNLNPQYSVTAVPRLSRRNFVRARSIAAGGRVRGSGRGERGRVRDPPAGSGVRGVDIRHRARGRAGSGGKRGHARAGHGNFDGTVGTHPHPVVVEPFVVCGRAG